MGRDKIKNPSLSHWVPTIEGFFHVSWRKNNTDFAISCLLLRNVKPLTKKRQID